MRPIDADEVFKAAYDMACQSVLIPGCEDYAHGLREAANYIENAPTLDVAPVRHGRWEQDYELVQGMEDNSEYPYVACNLCGHREYDVDLNDYTDYDDLPKYCPNCGAKMDAGQEDDKNA